MTTALFDEADDPFRPERLRAHGVDLTPPGLVVDLLLALAPLCTPSCVWDPCAGPGVWGQVGRLVWPEARFHGSDLRPEETGNQHYDDWRSGSALELGLPDGTDLVLTNPEFPVAFERHDGRGPTARPRESLVDFVRRRAPGCVIALLGTSQVGQRGDAVNIWREHPPSMQLRACAPVAFRGGSSTDSRDYSLWVWGLGNTTGWKTMNVPAVGVVGKAYRWEQGRPGDEPLLRPHVERILERAP